MVGDETISARKQAEKVPAAGQQAAKEVDGQTAPAEGKLKIWYSSVRSSVW